MPSREMISESLFRRMQSDNLTGNYPKTGYDDRMVTRRRPIRTDNSTIWRPAFSRDIDKILHSPYYNRYCDKTQVFSLFRNDDITRRSLHVQLVSRIARTIGRALHLNLDLIEAIALSHDIGHPPFAHTGEKYLNILYREHTGRYFCHNIHSVRVLDSIFPLNLSLPVLDGVAGHNGEVELETYCPEPVASFEQFDSMIEKCYCDAGFANKIQPSTLEGAVMRISDIIAYLGRDRQDAARIGMLPEQSFPNTGIGTTNTEIINNLVVNIIENSYGKPYIKMDNEHFQALKKAKKDNYALIYENEGARVQLNQTVRPMMTELYGQLLDDLKQQKKSSPIFTHHIDYVNHSRYSRSIPYESTEPNQLVVDYIASMTDDYFIDLYRFMYPDSHYEINYKGYFDEYGRGLPYV